MIATNGLRALVDAKVNFSSTKNMLVVSITLALGLGLGALSLMGETFQVGFRLTKGGFVQISPLAIATVVAIILNLVIPSKRGKTEEEIESKDKALYTLAGKVIDEEKNIEETAVEPDVEKIESAENANVEETVTVPVEEKVELQPEVKEEVVEEKEEPKAEEKVAKKTTKKKVDKEGKKDEEVK